MYVYNNYTSSRAAWSTSMYDDGHATVVQRLYNIASYRYNDHPFIGAG